MPKSKHRRKPGRKAVAHPGRGVMEKIRQQRIAEDIAKEDLDVAAMREAYAHLAPAQLIEEIKALGAEQDHLLRFNLDLPDDKEQRLAELDRLLRQAVPDSSLEEYLVEKLGYGTEDRPLPADYGWY